ncbi:MAG: Bcr/CflA family drug resistance efflux transporter [Burkholderiaceae bacterium]|nr:Bcr/CflA family drug resistance efflux transporter [Burkholderiaceae bacterium]
MSTRLRPLLPYRKAPLLTLISIFLMMQSLSTDMYVASMPSLASYFAVPASAVQLTLSIFVIGFGSAQLAVGPLSDRFGRRPVLLAGLSLYLAASLLCALAPSIWLLIAARLLQSLGCCSTFIIGRAIIRDAYAPEDGMRVMVKASSWLSLTPLLGPIVGSYFEVWFGWRATFAFHAIVASCLLTAVFLRLPETNSNKNPDATNLRGLLASYREVLGARVFWAYALPGALSYGSIFTFISGASMVLIRILHLPVTWFGYCFSFGTLGYMLATMLCQRLLRKMNAGAAFRIGTAASLCAGLLFFGCVLTGLHHWAIVVVAMFLTFAAHGINSPLSQAGAVTPFPTQAGTAAGLSGGMYMVMAFIIGSIVGSTFNGTLYPLAIISLFNGIVLFICVRAFPELRQKKEA